MNFSTGTTNDGRPKYLKFDEQASIVNKFNNYVRNAPIREKLLYDYGSGFAYAALLISNLFLLRTNFRVYYISRYNKGRFANAFMYTLTPVSSATLHQMYVRGPMTDMYASENAISYGLRSTIFHQLGIVITALANTTFSFAIAHRYGLLPVPDKITTKEAVKVTLKFVHERYKPHHRILGGVYIATSMLMLGFGVVEFNNSRALLGKIGRKSIGLDESKIDM